MKRLLVQQNQFSYAALFSRPAFPLWGDGGRIMDGLYTTFQKRGVNAASFRFEQLPQDPAAQSITVMVGQSCSYRLKLDRIEATLNNFSKQDFEIFAEILQEGAEWLRSIVAGLQFQSHLFTYFGHNRLSEGTSQDVLESIPTLQIPEIGESEGNGIIFHWRIKDLDARAQLLVDHSLSVTDGLFTQFLLFMARDSIDYTRTAWSGRGIMDAALKKIGLEIDDAK